MRTRTLALIAAGGLITAPASAYVLIGADWMYDPAPVSVLSWELNTSSFPASIGSESAIEAAFMAAMDTWTDAPNPYFAWTYAGTTTSTSWSNDGVMIAQWHANTSSPTTLAVTQFWSAGGNISECDMRFYGSNGFGTIEWGVNPAGSSWWQMDLQEIATHELGHCLGLDHPSNSGAIMFATTSEGGGPYDRLLAQDDIDGLNAIYTEYVPRPSLAGVTWTAIDAGDGDGFHEAGELIDLEIVVDNEGGGDATNARVVLQNSPGLEIATATGYPTNSDHPGFSSQRYYGAQIRVPDDCTTDGDVDFRFELQADNFNGTGQPWTGWVLLTCLGPDLDEDGVREADDLCEGHDDSKDRDGDGVPNGCDDCPNDALDDSDGDGVCDSKDRCAGHDDSIDTDGDGYPDGCDIPPVEEPAGCGCTTQGPVSPWSSLVLLVALARRR